jgi:hypothetical protein
VDYSSTALLLPAKLADYESQACANSFDVFVLSALISCAVVDEMDEVNDSMDENDVVLVIGANGKAHTRKHFL